MDQPQQDPALYVVATPIGNLEDMGARAIAVLKTVDLIIAEDTRVSAVLLKRFDIKTTMQSYHAHSSEVRTQSLLRKLRSGARLALISDAGTPLLSDPGYPLLDATLSAGIPVFSVPGPSALSASLAVCGIPSERFVFEGFLPSTSAARKRRLHHLKDEARALVFFEAPHRLNACLEDMHAIFEPDRRATLVREISKIHESVQRSTLLELRDWTDSTSRGTARVRGECVLIVEGAVRDKPQAREQHELLALLMEEMPLSRAVRLAVKLSGVAHSALYRAALEIKASSKK